MLLLSRIFFEILDIIFPPRPTQVVVRKAKLFSLSGLVKPQLIEIENHSVLTLLPYRSELVQAFILEAKFHNSKKAQQFLGITLQTYIRKVQKYSNCSKIVIIPIPLGKKRRKERGYNQVEQIARHATDSTIFLKPQMLTRDRETISQSSLKRNPRLKNMRGAFKAVSSTENTGLNTHLSYILLDDVVTTGATLLAADESLTKVGITNVLLLALAH